MRTAIEVRDWRDDLIEAVLAGRDAVGVSPNTPRNNISHLLPALSLPRPTIIVTPRPAVVEETLDRRGLAARIYVTPEQLQSNDCIELLRRNGASRLVVDHDLRPAYLGIAAVAWRLGRPPILAFVREEEAISDAIMLLGLRGPVIARPDAGGRR
jgi:ATP-dependent DNA helicase RecQ